MTIVAVRMDEETLTQITGISESEKEDRSTVIRKLLRKGIKEEKKELALAGYKQGKTTFSEAAARAGLTLWELEQYFMAKGEHSDYSLADLEKDLLVLKKIK